jgi:predicted amidohydrolase YtcJ
MSSLETWELLSYIVTVVGLPFAILVFLWEQRRERQTDEEELHQRLAETYADFLKLVLDNADLKLLRRRVEHIELDDEQKERRYALFGILISIFERAFVMVYEENMNRQRRRLWQTWDDYIQEWCAREDFRAELPELLTGEDPDFAAYMYHTAGMPMPRS